MIYIFRFFLRGGEQTQQWCVEREKKGIELRCASIREIVGRPLQSEAIKPLDRSLVRHSLAEYSRQEAREAFHVDASGYELMTVCVAVRTRSALATVRDRLQLELALHSSQGIGRHFLRFMMKLQLEPIS